MSKKVNFLRVIIFVVLSISPVVGLFYLHSRIIDIYMSILLAPIFFTNIFNEINVLFSVIFWIIEFIWIFILAAICEKILRFLYKFFKKV